MKFTLDVVQNGVIITKEDVDYKNEIKTTRVVFPSMFSAIDWVRYESREPEGLEPRVDDEHEAEFARLFPEYAELYEDGY